MPQTEVTPDELEARTIRRAELVPDRGAFIDTVLPECVGKENYALIGPGVAENADQVVPVTAPHGFNLGVAALPHGVTNSLHLHFTAEVFSCMSGKWLFRWGIDGTDGEAIIEPGDVISIPTWVFRGFTNVGADDGWMFSSLGQDENGGILWAPSVLKAAGQLGKFLSADNKMVDGEPGQPPEGVALTKPLTEEQCAELPRMNLEQMSERLVTPQELEWSSAPFLDSALEGGGAELALVIGYGLAENRNQAAPKITNPHGFSIAWLRAQPGQGVGVHRHEASQVFMVQDGRWRITLNQDNPVSMEIGPLDTFSVPVGAWRRIENIGDETGQLVVMTEGDGRVLLEWDDAVVVAAREQGLSRDTNGYLAPSAIVDRD